MFLDTPVSYDNMLKLLREGLEKLDLPSQDYTLHSPRVGAVSEAVNSGACDREFIQRHVRWASTEMVGRYHKMSLSSRLQPSLALSIYKITTQYYFQTLSFLTVRTELFPCPGRKLFLEIV